MPWSVLMCLDILLVYFLMRLFSFSAHLIVVFVWYNHTMSATKQKTFTEKHLKGKIRANPLVFWSKRLSLLQAMLVLLLFPPRFIWFMTLNFLLLPSADSSCLWNQFACSKNKCIAKQWLCDGENDCEDGLDESGQICG